MSGFSKVESKKQRIHQPRYRRESLGELIQIDGSHHRWFEDRGPKCTLLVYIDDATGRLMGLRFDDFFHSTVGLTAPCSARQLLCQYNSCRCRTIRLLKARDNAYDGRCRRPSQFLSGNEMIRSSGQNP